eukprot:6123585-Prymnesium_polylepis.2
MPHRVRSPEARAPRPLPWRVCLVWGVSWARASSLALCASVHVSESGRELSRIRREFMDIR